MTVFVSTQIQPSTISGLEMNFEHAMFENKKSNSIYFFFIIKLLAKNVGLLTVSADAIEPKIINFDERRKKVFNTYNDKGK